VVVYWLDESQLHGLVAGKHVEVDTGVDGSVSGEGGVLIMEFIIRRALDCDDSESPAAQPSSCSHVQPVHTHSSQSHWSFSQPV